jgi:WD40 repeat protein
MQSISPITRACLALVFCLAMLCAAVFEFRLTSLAARAPFQARPELILQKGHSMGVNCAAFAPDGTWVASGGSDNAILIWQTESGRQLRELNGHNGYIRSLAISGDGHSLASGSNDRTIKIWNVAEGRDLFTLTGHKGPVELLVFSRDGSRLISGSSDKTIKVWDLTSRKEIQSFSQRSVAVSALALNANEERLAAAEGNVIKLLDTKNWREVQTLRRHNAKVTALRFSDDGWLASTSEDGSILVWRADSDREQFVLKNNTSGVVALSFTLDGLLLVAHSDGGIDSWNYTTGTKKFSVAGKQDVAKITFASFSSDGASLVSTIGSRELRLRNVVPDRNERVLQNQSTAISAIAFSRDGRWFASAASDSAIRFWPIATGRELPRPTGEGHTGYATTIAFSPDSRRLASGSVSGEIKIWDVAANQLDFNLPSRSTNINRVAFSPDSKLLAVVGMDRTIQIWDLNTKHSRMLAGHTDEITSVVFVDDKRLITGGRDKTLRLWDLQTGATTISFDNLGAEVNALAVSPDGKMLAAGNADNTVRLWQLPNSTPLKTLTKHTAEVSTVAFSPDSKTLASGSADHTVMLWDLESTGTPRQLAGSSETVTSVSFNSDGKFLMAGSDDGSMLLWNPSTGDLRATIVSMPGTDDWLVATPDGLFDGSPESWNLMLWRFGGLTFNVVPVEAYFNEFYSPGVLAEVFNGKDPRATQDIVKKDRRQPQIKLNVNLVNNTAATRKLDIEIEVRGAPPDKDHPTESGAKDLRLFRNGLLVKRWTGDVLQNSGSQTLRTTIQVVAGPNQITAYAFNQDNIKSLDTTAVIRGVDSLGRQGAIHLLVIGVERYQNPEFNLKYAVDDAVEMNAQLRTQQERLGRYKPIVTIPLTNAEATKRNIQLALARLAGTSTGPLPPDAPRVLASIAPAQPEDAVVVYFSGHGTARLGHFYLIPHDLGYMGSRDAIDAAGLITILDHSISDEELVEALQPMDVDQLLVIIDACKSGQALKSTETRQGPMNTKGLAQLAYEKGLYVLTASQSFEVAFEADALKHSYLAYALLEQGIKQRAADRDRDGSIFLKEWFDYATESVPEIRKRNKKGKEIVEDEPDEQKVQRPRVFYTRETGARKFLIEK